MDPADVRKVVLEERPGATLDDQVARRARELLFGFWEMNWVAFNDGHDLRLPESAGKALPYFMYPSSKSMAFAVTASTPLPSDTKSPSSRSRRNENE